MGGRANAVRVAGMMTLVSVLTVGGRPTVAQTSKPAGAAAATTEPGSAVVVDQTSPKAAVKTLASAQVAGDAGAMRAVLLATGPDEERMSAAMVDLAVSIADFDRALIAKFGAGETTKVMGDPGEILRDMLDGIDHATEKVDGEQATLNSNPSPQGTMALKRVDGKWRVYVGDLAKAGTPENVRRTLESEDKGAAMYRELMADVVAGKFASADAAGTAMRTKMGGMGGAPSQPGTPPAAGGLPTATPPTTAPAR